MNKPNSGISSIDQYLQGFPKEIQAILSIMRSTIQLAAPLAMEKISYQIPTFYLNGNLVHFAALKNHIGFYPTPSVIAAFADELKGYKQAKGSVQFQIDKPLPLELIRKIVEFRVMENLKKTGKK